MEVFVISRENGNYYNSYEVYKIVDSEDKAKKIIKENKNYLYEVFIVE